MAVLEGYGWCQLGDKGEGEEDVRIIVREQWLIKGIPGQWSVQGL